MDEILRIAKPRGKIMPADFDAGGFRIFDRIHRREGRVHQRFPYRWSGVVSRIQKAGYRVCRNRSEHMELVLATGGKQRRSSIST